MLQRLCSKVACAREAVATLTYDYGDQMAVLGPLAVHREPHAHDLCAIHADRLSAPKGWQVVRHATMRIDASASAPAPASAPAHASAPALPPRGGFTSRERDTKGIS